jgi:hypothetical protein
VLGKEGAPFARKPTAPEREETQRPDWLEWRRGFMPAVPNRGDRLAINMLMNVNS